MSEKQKKESNRILIEYDLERRVGNVIPVGGGKSDAPIDFNTLPEEPLDGLWIGVAPLGPRPISVATQSIRQVTLLADAANVANVLVAKRNPQFPLIPGAAMTYVIKDLSKVYHFVQAVGDIVYWSAEAF